MERAVSMAEEIDAREERSPGFFESLSPKKENYPLVASIFDGL